MKKQKMIKINMKPTSVKFFRQKLSLLTDRRFCYTHSYFKRIEKTQNKYIIVKKMNEILSAVITEFNITKI